MSEVLLLHAGIADRRMWESQVAALEAAGHSVLAPDLPGFGDAPLEPGTIAYVDHAVSLLERPAHIVGCSFGGRIALELAVVRADLVEHLVLIGAGLGSWEWSE
jgi:pimeloyl-ACP methyl ester carboxylesterase